VSYVELANKASKVRRSAENSELREPLLVEYSLCARRSTHAGPRRGVAGSKRPPFGGHAGVPCEAKALQRVQ
jgi:hypothetical protein